MSMSRSIQIQCHYTNGKHINNGVFDGKNSDMVENPFTIDQFKKLIVDSKNQVGSKVVKFVNVNVHRSDSKGMQKTKNQKFSSLEKIFESDMYYLIQYIN